MKNIKSFDNFINEELSPELYKKTAKKLKDIGHVNRSRRMLDNIEEKGKLKIDFNYGYSLMSLNDVEIFEDPEEVYHIVFDEYINITIRYNYNITENYLYLDKIEGRLPINRKSAINLLKLIKEKLSKLNYKDLSEFINNNGIKINSLYKD